MSRDALIVGINTYTHLTSLRAPARDAEAIAQCLESHGDFDTVIRLPERIVNESGNQVGAISEKSSVLQSQLEQALKHLFRPGSSQSSDTALFYFSGHGIADQEEFDEGYLATSETDPARPRSGLSLRWLQWLLSESPVRQQIIWLDCCHSGGLLVRVEAANPGHGEQRDRCFIASSRDFEQSWQDLNSPYSVLTKALLDGLAPDRLRGRWVDSFVLVDYVNQALRGEPQKPICTNFGEAINLTRSWQVQPNPLEDDSEENKICPYKGLEFFDCNEEDPKYFFGREALTDQMLDKVRTSNFMALVGASGSGKSSVLRAGLLHQLKLGRRITGSDQWQILLTRPDATPMQNLAQVFVDDTLSQLDRATERGKVEKLIKEGSAGLTQLILTSAAPRVVLVIDQFEEIFTRCHDLEIREKFFECLLGALSQSDEKLCLIVSLRADFVGKCLEHEYSRLATWIQHHLMPVTPMTEPELKAAICKPAEQVGLTVQTFLLEALLKDIHGSPGHLPLMQYALKEVWKNRHDHQLTLESYQAFGGIEGTLQTRATALYESFDEIEQTTARHIFLALTQLGDGTEDTRRRVFLQDLVTPKHSLAQIESVLVKLTAPEHRLLVTSEVESKGAPLSRMAIVDVAHEVLIRHWSLLRQWIDTNRDRLRQQRKIEAAALEWRERGCKPGYLLQGLPLFEALQFQKDHTIEFPLSDSARHFIRHSRRQRCINQLKTVSWLLLPALLVGGVIEAQVRESNVKADQARLSSGSGYEERKAVQDLVQGCYEQQKYSWIPAYPSERFFGNCRSLFRAPLDSADLTSANLIFADLSSADLSNANLSSADLTSTDLTSADLSDTNLTSADLTSANLIFADLSSADLSSADLIFADLSNANLSSANLGSANLRSANLIYADLSDTNLRSANLSYAWLILTDFRDVRNLVPAQFNGEYSPLLCNTALPPHITDAGIDPNRDCDQLPRLLSDRYNMPLEEAQRIVDEARQKTWD